MYMSISYSFFFKKTTQFTGQHITKNEDAKSKKKKKDFLEWIVELR